MRLSRILPALVLVALVGAVYSLSVPWRRASQAEVLVDIPKGTGSRGMARLLAEAGVIQYSWQFLAVRVARPRAKLQAGEYLFREAISPWKVFDRLARGDVFYYQLTVPEGQNTFDIAESLDRIGKIRGSDFLEATRDASSIQDLAPEARSLEGFLFPDTYRITKHTTAADLCVQMTGRFRQVWKQLGEPRPVLPTVTLASLVEKETAVAEERSLVAAVFSNRLRLGMPLECDPTAIYAALLEGRYQGEISRADLDSKNRYNTYQYAGLPPGPIANAGLAALSAALRPAETRYLFFVARPDGSGAHVFSEQLDAHQRAVAKYRRANRKTDKTVVTKSVPGRKAARASH